MEQPDEKHTTGSSTISVEAHSDAMEEIITRSPSWLVSYGSLFLLFVVTILFVTSWLIKYPDLVTGSFELTTVNTPKSIVARSTGKIVRLFARDNIIVRKGDILAYMESTADHEEILKLWEYLKKVSTQLQAAEDNIPEVTIEAPGSLGELQTGYQTYYTAYLQYRSFLRNGLYQEKRRILYRDLADLRRVSDNLKIQESIATRSYELSKEDFLINQQLGKEKVIAPLELKKIESNLLDKEATIQEIKATLIHNGTEQSNKEKEILDIQSQLMQQKQIFLQATNTLTSSIDTWLMLYVVRAPISGRISFTRSLQEDQSVNNNQELFFITPGKSNYLGEMRVSQFNLGKVRIGQRVLIKFESYPHGEFGSVLGKTTSIASVPDTAGMYLINIALPEGLKTNFNKYLSYRNGLRATGEIITNDRRLTERILHNFRDLISR